MTQKCIALLGRRDAPTDAVEEYCRYLGEALRAHDFELELARVAWLEDGWPAAMRELERQAKEWRGCWVLVQYTALSWSERGFPLRFLRVLRILRQAGARVAMVYHDVLPYHGDRTIDKLRRRAQNHAMSEALRSSDLGVFTVPVSKIPWIGKRHTRTVFIPVGANLPEPESAWKMRPGEANRLPAIAVFGITGGEGGIWEIASISEALQIVAEGLGKLRLVVMGRHSDTAEKALKNLMDKQPIEVCALGILPGSEIVQHLASCDVLLFVRGGISSRRGSAIAGIACGLPVVALDGPETASPITEAGVVFADPKRQRGLGEALLKVLADPEYRATLAERSCRAQEKHFSWKAIAARYAAALRSADGSVS
ncbi:MAG TPA: glycosyltransferase [Candidatus Acidoferrum sp.]|nr:glycosyltransferase [Candidatus Acidoferrum sp.]